MKAFGIEIRKASQITDLYREVDRTLDNAGMVPGQVVSQSVQTQAVAHALQNMMKAGGHFSVCTIRNCIDVCQIHVPRERMVIYQAAHCISWNEMTQEYKGNY